MNDALVRTWVRLIRAGRKTIDDVPSKLRQAVEDALGEA